MKALKLGSRGPYLDPDHEVPSSAGEAQIKLLLGGICATDIELIKGYMGFSGVLGHEWVGMVQSAPDPALIGHRVVGEINCPCRNCDACRTGRSNHCPSRTVLGIQGRDGAFSEIFHLPQENLHRVPEGVSDEHAVFVEPLAAACRILEQCHIRPSSRVIVLGLGRLGQLCARVLALTGAKVLGVARRQSALDLLPSGIEAALVEDLQGERLAADFVVDCTGSSSGLVLSQSFLRPGGRLILKTTTHDTPSALSPASWVIDELTIMGSRCGPFDAALRLLKTGAVDPRPLITQRFPLEAGVIALEHASRPGALKVLLSTEPQNG
jgi:threonine dehydrogenase-like Zn-dependent dehydrogenase